MVESSETPLPAVEILRDSDANDFVLGMPARKYFAHTRKRALIIGVSDYSKLREIEGKEKYDDLP